MRFLLIFITFFTSMGSARAQTIFPDSAYKNHTWQTFIRIAELRDTINYQQADLGLLNAAVFFLTNKARESQRRPPFVFSPGLRNVASLHSEQMAKYEFVDHYNKRNRRLYSPQGRGRVYNQEVIAENVASSFLYNYESGANFYRAWNGSYYDFFTYDNEMIRPLTYLQFAQRIVNDWMESKGHRINILHPKLKTLGCAVSIGLNDMKKGMIPMGYGTQNFGL